MKRLGKAAEVTRFSIRRYRDRDLQSCRLLWAQLVDHHRLIYGDPTIGGKDPGLRFDRHRDRIGKDNIYVAVLDRAIVGLSGLIVKEGEAEIDPIVIREGCRRKGIGRKLAEHMRRVAARRKLKYLCIRPVARNRDAVSFYYELGYRKLGQIEMFMDLRPARHQQWKEGISLFGKEFEY